MTAKKRTPKEKVVEPEAAEPQQDGADHALEPQEEDK